MFGREGRPTPLGQAFAGYGRIAKTLHLGRVVDRVDDTYRRQMNRQLTVQESRQKLARRLSPLPHANLNCLGRYSFRAS